MKERINELDFSKLQQGSHTAFKKVYDAYYGLIRHVVTRCGFAGDDCLDIIHDTFLALYNRSGSIQSNSTLKAWLVVTARNICIDRLRHQKISKQHLQSQLDQSHAVSDGLIPQSILHELELNLLGELIESVKRETGDDTIWLFYNKGLSVAEIAEQRGESVSTITKRLSRLRNRFKSHFSHHLTQLRESAY